MEELGYTFSLYENSLLMESIQHPSNVLEEVLLSEGEYVPAENVVEIDGDQTVGKTNPYGHGIRIFEFSSTLISIRYTTVISNAPQTGTFIRITPSGIKNISEPEHKNTNPSTENGNKLDNANTVSSQQKEIELRTLLSSWNMEFIAEELIGIINFFNFFMHRLCTFQVKIFSSTF